MEVVQFRVAVLGGQGVGKTTLIEKFISLKCDSEGEDSSHVSVMLEEEESQLMFYEKHCEKLVNISCAPYFPDSILSNDKQFIKLVKSHSILF